MRGATTAIAAALFLWPVPWSAAQAQALDSREAWSTPLLYGGRLYAKGDTEFICFAMTSSR